MMLSPEAIKDFQNAYQADHGINLSDAEASQMASDLLGFYQLISRYHGNNS